MKNILLAYDGGEPAKRALAMAIDLTKTFGANLSVVSVVPVRTGRSPIDPWDDTSVHAQELLEAGYTEEAVGEIKELFRPVGCSACSKTGYRGRLALHEVMTASEEISRLTVARASTDDITRTAIGQGMIELKQDGWSKVAQGRTSIEEVLRVVVV